MLTASSLAIGYKTPLASNLDLELRPAELVCLIGPNGAGKSTLLRTLAGMEKPLAGTVWLDEENLHRLPPLELAKRLAIVLTERVNSPLLTARELVALGRHPHTDWLGRLMVRDEAAIERAMRLTDTLVFAERPIHELSDGERQKVMIARALAQILPDSSPAIQLPTSQPSNLPTSQPSNFPTFQPPNFPTSQPSNVLLLDEPTAFLDLPRRVELLQLLRRLACETGVAILLSTHDLDLALRLADRLWLISASGSMEIGLPEELALNGAIARVFQSEGAHFDPALGAFRVHQPALGALSLHGEQDGVTLAWTWRALERLGYEVHNNGVRRPIHIEILGETRWRLVTPKTTREFTSLESLLAALPPRDT